MRVYREIAIGWFESNCFAYFEESAQKKQLDNCGDLSYNTANGNPPLYGSFEPCRGGYF